MTIVRFDGVWKRYVFWTNKLRRMIEVLGQRAKLRNEGSRRDNFWALSDVTLDVLEGETLGLIGDNGAGKSTLLRLVAGVTYPTRGRVEVRGRVGALIEGGAGLEPDLTGRENVYIFGTMLGIPRRRMRDMFDSIVDFAEVEGFLDVPVWRYSTGMRVRLGFAVAAYLEPDIFLVDEALSVSDLAFQRKCIDRLHELQEQGTTIIFVSHDLATVERICHRTVWIRGGQVQEIGNTGQVIQHYRKTVERGLQEKASRTVTSRGPVQVERVSLTDASGRERFEFAPGESVTVNLYYNVPNERLATQVSFKIVDESEAIISAAHSSLDGREVILSGRGVVRCTFEALPLASRTFHVWGRVVRLPDQKEEVPLQAMAAFAISDGSGGSSDGLHEWTLPLLKIPTRWEFDGTHRLKVEDKI